MTEKRYFKRTWEEEYYIFDSKTISEKDFDEKVEYEDYNAFEDSLTGREVVRLLNENEQLKSLLKEVEHELTSLTGLSAYDKCSSQLGYDEVFDDDRIDLDYSDLLKKIEKVILND